MRRQSRAKITGSTALRRQIRALQKGSLPPASAPLLSGVCPVNYEKGSVRPKRSHCGDFLPLSRFAERSWAEHVDESPGLIGSMRMMESCLGLVRRHVRYLCLERFTYAQDTQAEARMHNDWVDARKHKHTRTSCFSSFDEPLSDVETHSAVSFFRRLGQKRKKNTREHRRKPGLSPLARQTSRKRSSISCWRRAWRPSRCALQYKAAAGSERASNSALTTRLKEAHGAPDTDLSSDTCRTHVSGFQILCGSQKIRWVVSPVGCLCSRFTELRSGAAEKIHAFTNP